MAPHVSVQKTARETAVCVPVCHVLEITASVVPVANALLARAAVPQANVVSLEPQKAMTALRMPREHNLSKCVLLTSKG